MGYKYDERELLDHAVADVLEHGIAQLTFGRLAKRIGINDRSIVYYFPTKEVLVTRVLGVIGEQLQPLLAEAFGAEPLPADELSRRAWRVMSTPKSDPVFAVFFEVVGLAAASAQPFDAVATQMLDGWIAWVEQCLDVPKPERRAAATAVVATIDGLLMIRQLLGARAANQAAAHLGFT